MSDNRALKLLEAFSGVEEDLLERCEQAVVENNTTGAEDENCAKERGTVISPAGKLREKFRKNSWKYGSAVAAVFCVAIVGLACMNGIRVGNDTAAFEEAVEDAAGVFVAETTGMSAPEVAMRQEDAGNSGGDEYSYRADDMLNTADKDFVMNTKGETPEPETAKTEDGIVGNSPEFSYHIVTEKQARTHELFGGYVPEKLPEGYGFVEAYISGEDEAAALVVSWTRGMDSIRVKITMPEKKPTTIQVDQVETYDEYLYGIPHAETVPEEYWDIFNNPVCAWSDFTLEFVQKRMIAREDAGDTDTPRGNFSVLYPDGVVVYFNGRGTAEEIWELFDSMEVK